MTFTIGYPDNGTAVATLVIPRVFGDNGHRTGVTNQQVAHVMASQNWGILQGIDCHEKKDFRTGENFRMMFIRWASFTPPSQVKKTLDDGGHIQVDIDNYGHFWKVRNFVPRASSDKHDATKRDSVVSNSPLNSNLNKWNVSDLLTHNTHNTHKADNFDSDFPPLVSSTKKVHFQDSTDFYDQTDPFCVSGLSLEELKLADQMQDDFDKIMYQNTYGYDNEV